MPCRPSRVCADPKIRIYDAGKKKYGVDDFPFAAHMVKEKGADLPTLAPDPEPKTGPKIAPADFFRKMQLRNVLGQNMIKNNK